MIRSRVLPLAIVIFVTFTATASLFNTSAQKPKSSPSSNAAIEDLAPSEMRPLIEYYVADRGNLQRSYPVATSAARRERFRKFYGDALEQIGRASCRERV